jgi:hypothetical protein
MLLQILSLTPEQLAALQMPERETVSIVVRPALSPAPVWRTLNTGYVYHMSFFGSIRLHTTPPLLARTCMSLPLSENNSASIREGRLSVDDVKARHGDANRGTGAAR